MVVRRCLLPATFVSFSSMVEVEGTWHWCSEGCEYAATWVNGVLTKMEGRRCPSHSKGLRDFLESASLQVDLPFSGNATKPKPEVQS